MGQEGLHPFCAVERSRGKEKHHPQRAHVHMSWRSNQTPRKQSWAPAEAGGACSELSWEREHFPHGSLGQEPNSALVCLSSGHAVALSWHHGCVCITRLCGPRGESSEEAVGGTIHICHITAHVPICFCLSRARVKTLKTHAHILVPLDSK